MKSDIDIIVENSKEFEKLLRTHFKAKGVGLGKLLDSIPDDVLPRSLRYILRRITYIRNGVIHGNKGIKNKKDFLEICEIAKFDLEKLISIQGKVTKIETGKAQAKDKKMNEVKSIISNPPIPSSPPKSVPETISFRKKPASISPTACITDCLKLLRYFKRNPDNLPMNEQALLDIIKSEYKEQAHSINGQKIINLIISNKYIRMAPNGDITYDMKNIAYISQGND